MTDGRQREEKGWEEREAFYRRGSLCRQRATPLSLSRTESQEKRGGVDDSSSVGRPLLHRGRRTQHCNFCHSHHRQNQEAKMCCLIAFIQNHTKERTQLVFVPASVQIGVWRKSPSRLLSRKLSPLACETTAADSRAFFPEIIPASSSLSRRHRRHRNASEQEAVMVVLLLPSPPLFKAPVSFPPCLKWRRGERGSRSIFRQKLHFAFPLVFLCKAGGSVAAEAAVEEPYGFMGIAYMLRTIITRSSAYKNDKSRLVDFYTIWHR